jgi:hypothetical protein
MNIGLSHLIEALRRSLQDDVQPELTSDHARGQLAAALDVLGKLERMAVWSPDAAAQQAQVLADGCAAFRVRAAQARVALPVPASVPEAAPASAAAEQALLSAEAHLMQLTDWLFDSGAGLADPARADLHAILRRTLRQQLLIQRKQIPLTDFGAMTAVAKPEPAPPSRT